MFENLKFKFRHPAPAQAPRAHVVAPRPAALNIKRATAGDFRNGMWVVVGQQVGILTSMNPFGVCTVMATDAEGFNVLELQVPLAEIGRATIRQIPAQRIAHLSTADLERMGYTQ